MVAFFKRPDGTWYGIKSRVFINEREPILMAREVLERHHATLQSAAAAVIDSAGEVIWQGTTHPESDIRIQTTTARKRAHLSRSEASDSGGGV